MPMEGKWGLIKGLISADFYCICNDIRQKSTDSGPLLDEEDLEPDRSRFRTCASKETIRSCPGG